MSGKLGFARNPSPESKEAAGSCRRARPRVPGAQEGVQSAREDMPQDITEKGLDGGVQDGRGSPKVDELGDGGCRR